MNRQGDSVTQVTIRIDRSVIGDHSQLRELEADGLIGREVFATVPPTVEYRLTAFGQTILPMMEEIKKWGLEHRSRQEASGS